MKLTKDILVASRYQLVECLGAGAMGEVWRAQDTRFESRTVAVKFLREDETLKEDALNRDRLVIRLEQQASRGSLTLQSALEAIAAALGASNLEGLRAKADATLGSGPFKPADIVTVFDELVNDPTFNDNARMRAKLRRLFRDEANAVANLRHDNVVSIFDYGDHEGSPYLVMDYIEGRTVYQVIQAQEMLPRSRRLQLIEDLCSGLGYAHKHKLVHRDIKPANLIIDGSTGSLKILDFGVVRRLGSASTVGVPVGTFCYMSPEQTKGAATLDHRSDIFAVGLVFYELMSGKKAFPPGKSIGDLVARIQRDPPPPLLELVPSIPKSIEEIIQKAVQKLPENRYQDLSVMEREIAKVRAKIEAQEASESSSITMVGDATIVKTRPPAQPNITDLLAKAERALEAADANGAIELARQVLAVQPGFAPAQGVVNRAETLKRDGRVRDVLQQAEKFLALEELTSARGVLATAREVDAASPQVKAFEARLDAAAAKRAAALDRAQRDREERERDQRAREQKAREQQAREQQEVEQRRVREQQELEQRRAREQQELEQRQQAQRERDEREKHEREERARDERAREERARMQRELEQREQQQRDAEQRDREKREREKKEREQREREAHERALRDLAKPLPGEASPDEPTAVTMQLPRDIIRPPMAAAPRVDPAQAKAKTAVPAAPPSAPPVAPPPPPPVPPAPPQTAKPGGPSRKSKRYSAGPSKSGIPVPAPSSAAPPVPSAAARPTAAVPQAPIPPAGQARSGVSPMTLGIAVGVILLLAIVAGLVYMMQSSDSPPAQPQQQQQAANQQPPPVTTTPPPVTPPSPPPPVDPNASPTPALPTTTPTTEPAPPVDPPAPASMSTVYIDIRPWARVKITSSTPGVTLPADAQYAPFAIDLPAGDYNLEAENGGLNRATAFQLKVAESGAQTFVRSMPGFNATKIVESLLGQD